MKRQTSDPACRLCGHSLSVVRVAGDLCGRCVARQYSQRLDGPLVREAMRLGCRVKFRSQDRKPKEASAKAPKVRAKPKTKPKVHQHPSLPLWSDG